MESIRGDWYRRKSDSPFIQNSTFLSDPSAGDSFPNCSCSQILGSDRGKAIWRYGGKPGGRHNVDFDVQISWDARISGSDGIFPEEAAAPHRRGAKRGNQIHGIHHRTNDTRRRRSTSCIFLPRFLRPRTRESILADNSKAMAVDKANADDDSTAPPHQRFSTATHHHHHRAAEARCDLLNVIRQEVGRLSLGNPLFRLVV